MRFPEFKNNEPKSNTSARKKLSKHLKAAFEKGGLDKQMQIIATFPSDHDNHLQGESSGYSLPLNKEMGVFIKTMAREGVRSVTEMERHLVRYRADKLTMDVQKSNRSYFPSKKTIRNHIYCESILSRFSNDDQINLKASVEKWQKEDPEGKFFLRIASQEEDENPKPFLFVHQTVWQQNILQRFGQQMCILDSTYNTTKFELPLYLMCVQTNVGFVVVASIMLGKDTKANLVEALTIIRNWNHSWQPSSFMCDYDTREIGALEFVFNGCDVYLCDFHREQAWQRWINDGKNNLLEKKSEVLQLFRSLAYAETEDSYESALKALRHSAIYQEQPHLSNYIEKKWITQSKRWVKAFRGSGQCKVNTTNGLERQHRELKENFLNIDNPGKCLTDMICSFVNNYLPKCKERFIERNVQCLEGHRSYSKDVPKFLVGRPKPFVSHCIKRMTSSEDVESHQIEEGLYTAKSVDSDRTFRVTLRGQMPSCTCPDFQDHKWPCKHMLAILCQSDNSWDMLDESFKNTIFNTVDVDFVDNIDIACVDVQEDNGMEFNNVGEDVPKDESKLRNECFDLLKQLETDLYNISSTTGLNSILQHLNEAYCLSQNHVINIKGLPLRRGKKKMAKKRTRKIKKGSSKTVPMVTCTISQEEDTTGSSTITTKDTSDEKSTVKDVKGSSTITTKDTSDEKSTVKDVKGSSTITTKDTSDEKSTVKDVKGSSTITTKDTSDEKSTVKDVKGSSTITTKDTSDEKSTVKDVKGSSTITTKDTSDEKDATVAEAVQPSDVLFDVNYVVRKIWAVGPVGHLIAKVGPNLITDYSIKYLQTTLSDEVIDAYLFLISSVSKYKKVYHIETAVAKAIFEDASGVHGGLKRITLSDYDIMIGAVNESNCHWTLCAVYPKEQKIVYINPLGETPKRKDLVLGNWRRFLLHRYNTGLDGPPTSGQWKMETKSHMKQYDSVSCGIYVLKFAEDLLCDRPLKFRSTQNDLKAIRLGIATQLLEISEPLDMYCRKCCLTETSETVWIQCDSCPKWFHLSCLDITEHTNIAEIQSKPYLCKFCLKEYDEDEKCMLACRNTGRLRVNPQKKRKRSSFVYQPLKKTKLDNIKKPMKEEKSAPTSLLPNKKRRRISRTKIADYLNEKPYQRDRCDGENAVPPLEFPQYVSNEEQREQDGMINLADIKKHIQEIYSRLKAIVRTQTNRASMSGKGNWHPQWISRHAQYLTNGQPDDWKHKGYGLSFFNQSVQHSMERWVERAFYVDIGTCLFTKWGSIRGACKKLQDRMTESPYEADTYVKNVLVKECMAVAVETVMGVTYSTADKDCSQTSATSLRKVFRKQIGLI